jgi:hypothetical protein
MRDGLRTPSTTGKMTAPIGNSTPREMNDLQQENNSHPMVAKHRFLPCGPSGPKAVQVQVLCKDSSNPSKQAFDIAFHLPEA